MQTKEHWERVYTTKHATEVSWYQPHADQSLAMIRDTGIPLLGNIIDVGGGASMLVDDLVAAGYTNITVLDISSTALETAKLRLADRAGLVTWLQGDVTTSNFPSQHYDVWHDRAVFHFLINAEDRRAYAANVSRTVKRGGHVILATFAEDGPTQCSGLPVMRYAPDQLHAQFGDDFALVKQERESHHTPFGTVQRFIYCYCRVAGK